MKYVKTQWFQSAPDEPILFYEEIGDGKVIRFLEEFADGTFGFADAQQSCGGTWLPEEACPVEDGGEMSECKSEYVSQAEFEEKWRRAQANVRAADTAH
jgi:hypothetical protein